MAYELHHTITFQNPITENIYIELYKKDVEPPYGVTALKALTFRQSYPKGDGKYNEIIACECLVTLFLKPADVVDFTDFIVTYFDEWKMIAYSDGQKVFEGFLTPGEGTAEFQNKPYEVTINAICGLGLLKGVELSDESEEDFTGVNLITTYLTAIFKKTGLTLPFRVISSWVEESMTDRLTDPTKDTLNQTSLHARTFLKNPTDFYDCYEVLSRICTGYFCIYQWFGKWVILNIGEMQASPGAKLWYTDYDSDGVAQSGAQSELEPCWIGNDKILEPINRTHFIGADFAIKYARTEYRYNPWPELPTNNKFDRGSILLPIFGNVFAKDTSGNDTADQIGTYQGYDIDDWTKGDFVSGSPTAFNNLPSLNAATGSYARLSSSNDGTEFEREIALTHVGGTNIAVWLQSEGFQVKQGDRINLDFEYKLSYNFSYPGSDPLIIGAASVYIINGSDRWSWRYRQTNNKIDNFWLNSSSIQTLSARFENGEATKNYVTVSAESPTIPIDGTMYIVLINSNQDSSTTPPYISYFKKFNFQYRPFIAGGYLSVNGDYWRTTQNLNINDKIDEEVYLSDGPREVMQGTLFRADLSTLTTKTWHRDNVLEERGFKELGNIARFNHQWRRMWKTRGVFSGLKFQPYDDSQLFEPLSFHRHFFLPDKGILGSTYFMPVPPLTIDHHLGRFDGTFYEVLNTAFTNEGEEIAAQMAQQFKDEINAAASSTFSVDGTASNRFVIFTNDANTVSVVANDNGVGNSPSITIISEVDVLGPLKRVEVEIGTDIQPANSFTVTITGIPAITLTSESLVTLTDGNNLGNSHTFNYIFE